MGKKVQNTVQNKISSVAGNSKTPLEKMTELLSNDMKSVNSLILKHMNSGVPMIPELVAHLIAAGGKRLRPMLAVASAKLLSYNGDAHYKLAASVEFIHTATLLHDDVVDESDLRRGKEAAHKIFGNEAAVLVGDFLFSRAFQLMVEIGSIDILDVLSNASAVIAEGEVMQLSAKNDIDCSLDDYLAVIRSKTAALFAAACETGGIAAACSQEQREALRIYGENLGIAFQMIDDLLDYSLADTKLGKNTGDDFKEGKITLPIILAVGKANYEEKDFWLRTCGKLEQTDTDFQKACSIINNKNIINEGIELATSYGKKAQEAISIFDSKSELQNSMFELIDFVVNRDF